jgi:hypothetical protein
MLSLAPPKEAIGPIKTGWPWIIVVPFLYFSIAIFASRSRLIDAWMAYSSYGVPQQFVSWIKPTVFAAAFFIATGIAGFIFTYINTQNFGGYVASGFTFSAGVGVLAAYLFSLVYPPRLI